MGPAPVSHTASIKFELNMRPGDGGTSATAAVANVAAFGRLVRFDEAFDGAFDGVTQLPHRLLGVGGGTVVPQTPRRLLGVDGGDVVPQTPCPLSAWPQLSGTPDRQPDGARASADGRALLGRAGDDIRFAHGL